MAKLAKLLTFLKIKVLFTILKSSKKVSSVFPVMFCYLLTKLIRGYIFIILTLLCLLKNLDLVNFLSLKKSLILFYLNLEFLSNMLTDLWNVLKSFNFATTINWKNISLGFLSFRASLIFNCSFWTGLILEKKFLKKHK